MSEHPAQRSEIVLFFALSDEHDVRHREVTRGGGTYSRERGPAYRR